MALPDPQNIGSGALLSRLGNGSALPQPDGGVLIGLADPGGQPTGVFLNASGLPQILLPAGTLSGAAALPLPLFLGSGGAGSTVAALPLVVNFQPTPDGVLVSLQQTDLASVGPANPASAELAEPARTIPLQVSLLDGTQLTIDVGLSGQALVLQLPPELSRQDALRSGVLAALAKSLGQLGVSMDDIKSIVLLQKRRQLASR